MFTSMSDPTHDDAIDGCTLFLSKLLGKKAEKKKKKKKNRHGRTLDLVSIETTPEKGGKKKPSWTDSPPENGQKKIETTPEKASPPEKGGNPKKKNHVRLSVEVLKPNGQDFDGRTDKAINI
jgi:hypothetical protein